ncbi:helix-turn-helix transcriptional regulator [Allorhizocola rhizosphaerae]|uniref:helix-turn-helix transcriptional regulator n=1 Tax=Allorhizocola rhizosphaerae TaxID=1872709 RepID=UPI0013C34311|nr:helix-turn-helix transcriptional regulator [Allorhizocola rhizosphaerae]
MFEALGIDRSDELVYFHLIRRGPTSLAALAAATGQGRRAARAAVARLRSRGLAQLSPPPHEQAIAVPIEVGVEHLIRQRRHDLELVRHTAARLAAELTPRTDHQPTVLSRRTDALQQLHQSAQREFRMLVLTGSMLPAKFTPRENLAYRIVSDASGPLSIDDIFKTRFSKGVPVELALADASGGLVELEHGVLQVKPGRLLDAVSALFEAYWAGATPAASMSRSSPTSSTSSTEEVDPQDRAVLSLLVAGLTDDAVGARLGMSRRTVARRVHRLMEATGAHSRLQLGWWARERNWLQ